MQKSDIGSHAVNSDHQFLLKLLPPVYALTHRLVGRGYGFAMRRLKPFYAGKLGYATYEDGSRFYYRLGDDYWNRLQFPEYQYEPELAYFFAIVKDTDYVFIDAGANLGYWSVLISSKMLGEKRAIAVEASSETFKMLQLNCDKNDNRFTVLRNAVFNKVGETLSFSTGPHEGRHIDSAGGQNTETVSSITLDYLASAHGIKEDASTIIKLDVEGGEILALEGSAKLLERDTLIIYECHGKDMKHEATKYIMNELGLSIFYIDARQTPTQVEEVTELQRLDEIKTISIFGYNFFACKNGSVFHDILTNAAVA